MKNKVRVITPNGVMSQRTALSMAMLKQIGYEIEVVDLSKETPRKSEELIFWYDEDTNRDDLFVK